MHTCNVVGNRQMVSVGGIVVYSNTTMDTFVVSGGVADPWPQGLGIFDMSAMEWTSSYNASAAPYVTPNLVKSYYQQNGRYPASWTNPDVTAWFTGKSSECRI